MSKIEIDGTEYNYGWKTKSAITLVALLIVGLFGLAVFRVTCVTFVDNYEMGFIYDRFTGKIEKVNRTGWILRWPIAYNVHTIDTRPYQVSISANSRILNAKLIRFNTDGLDKFVEWHGRSAGDDTRNLLEILKCYAFDKKEGRDCPFLTVVSEVAPDQGFDQVKKGMP